MSKKVIVFLLMVSLFLVQQSSVKGIANDIPDQTTVSNMTEEELNEILMLRGASEVFLSKIPVHEKKALVECGADGFQTKSEIYTVSELLPETQIVSKTISEKELSLDITTSHILLGTPNAIVFLYVTYEWKDLPLWRLTDYMSLTWDDNIFLPYDGSTLLVDYFTSSNNELQYTKEHNETYDANSNSVIWQMDIWADGTTVHPTVMKSGYGSIRLKIKDGIDHFAIDTVFSSTYAHSMVFATPGLSLSNSGFGVSVTPSVNVDQRGITKHFNTSSLNTY